MLRWLGHELRMKDTRKPKRALQWTPQGRRKVGRSAVTWRSTIKKELIEMGMTWGEARVKAKDRFEWKSKEKRGIIFEYCCDYIEAEISVESEQQDLYSAQELVQPITSATVIIRGRGRPPKKIKIL
ncbi:endonuclease-reverse transcriptase [Brachionus plicatilis]|uniref:Endonuclease-reverse transcriptase n=1 Tax=Brachionus plicatilis TaxID=10195 RepID=A0A3M7RL88_BRAPC|nr:endonuclease-reverse transcriptase [Brachionus plicatilis]